jgi:diguanylate cyclase (GGDEF)-like protein/PAS domain S-box-containing protein
MARRALLLPLLLLIHLPAWGLERVSLQLNWKHQFQFAGYYAAIEKGYYRDAGLAVDLHEAESGKDPIEQVLQGKAEFGIGASELALLRGQGKPVVALAAILQHSPLVLLMGKRTGLESSHDLVGRKIMLMPHEAELYAYLKREQVKLTDITMLPHSFDPKDLISGRVDAFSGYSCDEPFLLQQARFPYIQFSPRSSGIDFYGDTLFTTAAQIRSNPERVQRFRDASLRGWRYAIDHPEEIADLILSRHSQRHSRAHLLFEAKQMRELMQPDLVEIGHMIPGRWRHIANVYAEVGMLPADASIDGLLYDPAAAPAPLPDWFPAALTALSLLAIIGAVIAARFGRLHRQLKESEAHHRQLMELAPMPVVVTRLTDNTVVYINRKAATSFGFPQDQAAGRLAPSYWVHPEQRAVLIEKLKRDGAVSDLEAQLRDDKGREFWAYISASLVDQPDGPVAFVAFNDISERKQIEHQMMELQLALRDQATRDPLTGLFNRRYLDETLERELARARREGHPVAVVMIDLDHFKRINDTYGHRAGDQMLQAFAAILQEDSRTDDVACRHGGEEFLMLMPCMSLEMAWERSEQWRRRFKETKVVFGDFTLEATASFGVAGYPYHGKTPDDLVHCADQALYLSKQRGRNRVTLYDATGSSLESDNDRASATV